MVKVYQRAPPSLPRSSSVHAICCSPHHSPRPSLIASTAYTRPLVPASSGGTGTGSYCDFVNIKHVKTGEVGCSFVCLRLCVCACVGACSVIHIPYIKKKTHRLGLMAIFEKADEVIIVNT